MSRDRRRSERLRRGLASSRPAGGDGPERTALQRRSRPLFVESLEPRTLLDGGLHSTVFSAAQKQVIFDGLSGLANWADTLDGYGQLAQKLPVVGQTIGNGYQLRIPLAVGDSFSVSASEKRELPAFRFEGPASRLKVSIREKIR